MPGDILDLIDHALEDWTSADAMRWAPEDRQEQSRPVVPQPRDPPRQGLYAFLLDAMHDVHPAVRHHPETRWVMNRDWYDRVRAMAFDCRRLSDSEPEPARRDPHPDDCLMGIPLTVTADGGEPHLENPRASVFW